MIVAVGGLPFTGKSTLARSLSEAIPGLLLDAAALQRVLFPSLVVPPREVNDWLYESVLKATSWNLDTTPGSVIVLDGRPLTRTRDALSLRRFAATLGHALHIVECVCPDDVARARSAAAGALYPPPNAGTDPIPEPAVVVNTCRPLEECISIVLDAVLGRSETTPTSSAEPMHPV
ncbi:AAA family ATPase [Streptomyces sp. NPDC057682]|uniref:AAA family ATPase n=1 Tax=Streptomyces sp. NPDC057682 TaxID=3346210 RepID=UPI0036B36C05